MLNAIESNCRNQENNDGWTGAPYSRSCFQLSEVNWCSSFLILTMRCFVSNVTWTLSLPMPFRVIWEHFDLFDIFKLQIVWLCSFSSTDKFNRIYQMLSAKEITLTYERRNVIFTHDLTKCLETCCLFSFHP